MVSFCWRMYFGSFQLITEISKLLYFFWFLRMVFHCNLKSQNYNVNSTYIWDIKSWYAQKRQTRSSRMPGLDKLQVIELEHVNILDTMVGALKTETTDAHA